MSEYNMNDALNNPIILGNKYGYSTDSSGVTKAISGTAIRFTPKGLVTLENPTGFTGLWMNEPNVYTVDRKTVSCKAMKLFPVS